MRIVVAFSILGGILLLIASLIPSRPERLSLPTIDPLRVSSGIL